jgi:hypothetical protein
VADGDDYGIVLDVGRRVKATEHGQIQQSATRQLDVVVKIANGSNGCAGIAHPQQNVGNDLGVTAGAQNQHAHYERVRRHFPALFLMPCRQIWPNHTCSWTVDVVDCKG